MPSVSQIHILKSDDSRILSVSEPQKENGDEDECHEGLEERLCTFAGIHMSPSHRANCSKELDQDDETVAEESYPRSPGAQWRPKRHGAGRPVVDQPTLIILKPEGLPKSQMSITNGCPRYS